MVASVTGPVMAIRADVGYASAKAGMVGLTRAAAVDAARHGITVNAVAPGWIATGSQTPEECGQGRPPRLAGAARPGEIAAAIAWLAAPARPTSPGNTWSWTAATRSPSTRHTSVTASRPARTGHIATCPVTSDSTSPAKRAHTTAPVP